MVVDTIHGVLLYYLLNIKTHDVSGIWMFVVQAAILDMLTIARVGDTTVHYSHV